MRTLLLLSLAACSPSVSMPSPAPLPLAHHEVGLTASYTVTQGAVESGECTPEPYCSGPDAFVTWRTSFRGGVELGLIAGGGKTRVGTGGVMVRQYFVDTKPVRFGFGLDIGYAFASIHLPLAVRLAEGAWIWTNPSAGHRAHGIFYVPVGFSLVQRDGFVLNAEVGTQFYARIAEVPFQRPFLVFALGAGFQVGRDDDVGVGRRRRN